VIESVGQPLELDDVIMLIIKRKGGGHLINDECWHATIVLDPFRKDYSDDKKP
jgi:hypothetical protein